VEDKPVPVPLCPPRGAAGDRTRTYDVWRPSNIQYGPRYSQMMFCCDVRGIRGRSRQMTADRSTRRSLRFCNRAWRCCNTSIVVTPSVQLLPSAAYSQHSTYHHVTFTYQFHYLAFRLPLP
jgi:hypothetical protein